MNNQEGTVKFGAWNNWRNFFVLAFVAFVIAKLRYPSALAFTVGAVIVGCLSCYVAYTYGRMFIITSNSSIIVLGRSIHLELAWQDIIVCEYRPVIGWKMNPPCHLSLGDGHTQFSIGSDMGTALVSKKTCHFLGKMAQERSHQYVLAHFLKQYHNNQAVYFGRVSISTSGVKVNNKNLVWADVDKMVFDQRGNLNIFSKKSSKVWQQVPSIFLVNLFLFHEFMAARLTTGGSSEQQVPSSSQKAVAPSEPSTVMQVIDHEPYSWFLLKDQESLILDVNCTHGAAGWNVVIRLDQAETAKYRQEGRAYIQGLAGKVSSSATGMPGSRSPFTDRVIVRVLDEEISKSIRNWRAATSKVS